jgi:membrane carboxypeptidase/penicillin-binding protein PbpC
LRVALGSSFNVPAVKIFAAFGVKKMIQRGQEMGITTWTDPSRYGLSLTLGGGEVKMTDLAIVYGVLANSGIRVDLNPILEVSNSQGKILEKNSQGKNSPVLSQSVAYLLTNILADNSARTTAFGPNSLLYVPNRPVAVKTGTTQNMRDNWTIGYTPSLLAAVWVGNNDGSPMSYVASGITGASPIWRKIMDQLLEGKEVENFVMPPEVKEIDVCQTTSTLPCSGCPLVKKEFFILGTEPQASCSGQWFTPTPSVIISPYYLH